MNELKLTVEEWETIVVCLQKTLGISRWLASIMICRMIEPFNQDDIESYGTLGNEMFTNFVQDRSKERN